MLNSATVHSLLKVSSPKCQEGTKTSEPRTYTWTVALLEVVAQMSCAQVLAYYPNPEYDPDLAQERMNDPNNPYTVDQPLD